MKQPTKAELLQFAESKNPIEKYNWRDPAKCAIGQFLATIHNESYEREIENWDIACAQPLPHTFGAFAERVRERARGP